MLNPKLHILISVFTVFPSGWGAQAQEHSSQARELLLSQPAPTPCSDDGPLVLTWLLRSGLTQGAAAVLTSKYPNIAQLAVNLIVHLQ